MSKLQDNMLRSYQQGLFHVNKLVGLRKDVDSAIVAIRSLRQSENMYIKDKETEKLKKTRIKIREGLDRLNKAEEALEDFNTYKVTPTKDSLNYFLKLHYHVNEAVIKYFISDNCNLELIDIKAYICSEGMTSGDMFIEFRKPEKNEVKRKGKKIIVSSSYKKEKNLYYYLMALEALDFVGEKVVENYVDFNRIFN